MGCVCETFVGYVLASAAPDVQVCVVFDCYDQQTTKAPEQKRRRLKTGSYPDVVLEDNTPVPGNKEAFLGNMANKQHLFVRSFRTWRCSGDPCGRRRGC